MLIDKFDKVPSILEDQPSQIIYGEGAINWDNNQLKISIPPRSGLIIAP